MAADKIPLSFTEITARLKACKLPDCDHVVGVGSGGAVFASLVAYQLGRPLSIMELSYRDPDNQPRYSTPKLLSDFDPSELPAKLLLVDDVSVSGKTLETAKELLGKRDVTTVVLKGKADIVLFPKIASCVHWPWHA